jgi:hypothetical protein
MTNFTLVLCSNDIMLWYLLRSRYYAPLYATFVPQDRSSVAFCTSDGLRRKLVEQLQLVERLQATTECRTLQNEGVLFPFGNYGHLHSE